MHTAARRQQTASQLLACQEASLPDQTEQVEAVQASGKQKVVHGPHCCSRAATLLTGWLEQCCDRQEILKVLCIPCKHRVCSSECNKPFICVQCQQRLLEGALGWGRPHETLQHCECMPKSTAGSQR